MNAPAMELPELGYDSLEVGQRFSETTLDVTPDMVRSYARAVHNDSLMAQAGVPAGTPLCDPSIVILFGIARRALR